MPLLHSILAVELCYVMHPGDGFAQGLRQAITRHPATASLRDRWTLYRHVAESLHNRLPQAVSGCWDFFDDDAKARSDFEMWFGGMATREGARRAPSGHGDPYRGDHRYMTFTMALLLRQGAPCERNLRGVCHVPEPMLWQRDTFARILRAVPTLSFAAVARDVVYVIPRDDDWGLTAEDLRAEKFHYLRPLA